MTQYPHTLQIKTVPQSTKDAKGNYIPGGSPVTTEVKCRVETRGSAGTIITADSKTVLFRCIIYMPYSVPDIQAETTVTVMDGNKQILKGTVLQFARGQLNARIWL